MSPCTSTDLVCLQVLYRESLVIEDWELDEREGGERTAHDYEHLRWEQSASRRSLLAYLEASRSNKSDAQVCAQLTHLCNSQQVSCTSAHVFITSTAHLMFNCSYCTGARTNMYINLHCSAVALSRTRAYTRLLRRKRPLLALRARTPLVRQLLQRSSARPAPRRSTGPQSKSCTVRSERRHARLAHPSSTPERWAAARCSSTRNYTTLLVLNYSSWFVFRSSTTVYVS